MSFADSIVRADRAVLSFLGGEEIEYRPEIGGPITVEALFDANHEIQDPITGRAEQVGPVVWFRLGDIAPHDPRTDNPTLVIAGNEYRPRERAPDSPVGGTIRIHLQRT